jgi:hypothetical protein
MEFFRRIVNLSGRKTETENNVPAMIFASRIDTSKNWHPPVIKNCLFLKIFKE